MSAAQLAAAGARRREIERLITRGLLRRVHRGVYHLGAVEGPWFAEWAAILACGPRAVLGYATALALWALAGRPAEVHVVRPTRIEHEGIRGHRGRVTDVRHRHGLPVTSPARTLADVASSMPKLELARLVEEAQVRRLVTRDQLERTPARRAVLQHEPSLTRSEAETRVLALIRAARLPAPRTNVRVAGVEVDMLWPRERLIVEIDGFAFHGGRAAFERDRRRDARLVALGYRVLRITWRQLTHEPHAVVATIAAALATPARAG